MQEWLVAHVQGAHTYTHTHKMLSYTPFGPHAGVACCPCSRRTHIHTNLQTHTRCSRTHLLVHMQEWLVAHVQDTHTHTQDTLVRTFWSTCRSGLLPMYKTHTHTHTRCSRTHLLVHMQEWLVAHIQGTHELQGWNLQRKAARSREQTNVYYFIPLTPLEDVSVF